MTFPSVRPAPLRLLGTVVAQEAVSASMRRLDLELERPTSALPGQFCMINLFAAAAMALSRPLSILAAAGNRLSLLYKVVGRGTRLLSDLVPGATVRVFTPLGTPFEPRDDARPRLLLAGGVGLPPLALWYARYGRPGDLACFGARDGADAPWPLLPDPWHVSVDVDQDRPVGRSVHVGTVVDLARRLTVDREDDFVVLTCGPIPLLAAARALAGERGWACAVSVEERMGCGYGVCRGCVVPASDDGPWLLGCRDGPVLPAAAVAWERFGSVPAAATPASACLRSEEESP